MSYMLCKGIIHRVEHCKLINFSFKKFSGAKFVMFLVFGALGRLFNVPVAKIGRAHV